MADPQACRRRHRHRRGLEQTTWPSGGPFVLDTFEKNKTITFIRNDRYWKTDAATGMQLPYLDGVEFRIIFETEQIIGAFKAREVDVIQPPPWLEGAVEPLKKLEPAGAVIEVIPGAVWEHVSFQLQRQSGVP